MEETNFGHGAIHTEDPRDIKYEEHIGGFSPFDWATGFDVEKHLNFTLPIKNQWSSESCVGQGWSYKTAIANLAITGKYDEVSAKAIYSQIFLPGGGADIRQGGLLTTKFGELLESIVASHKADGSVDEPFMEDTSWITPQLITMAKNLQTQSVATVNSTDMDTWACAIRDNNGIVAGVTGTNNGTWNSLEPTPPTDTTPQNSLWGHCLYFGKAGVDSKGKYISTPNSWGSRGKDDLHPDGWQKLRQSWFDENGKWLFNAWTLINKVNKPTMAKLLKDTKSPACGFWIPAVNEQELINQAKLNGYTLPLNAIGGIDWQKIKLDGSATLK